MAHSGGHMIYVDLYREYMKNCLSDLNHKPIFGM